MCRILYDYIKKTWRKNEHRSITGVWAVATSDTSIRISVNIIPLHSDHSHKCLIHGMNSYTPLRKTRCKHILCTALSNVTRLVTSVYSITSMNRRRA